MRRDPGAAWGARRAGGQVHCLALGTVGGGAGRRWEGAVAAMSVLMEPCVFFTGRCTMLEAGTEGVEIVSEGRARG